MSPLLRRSLTAALSLPLFAMVIPPAVAATVHPVINEVCWAGSADSSSDEWIELANPSSASIDLTGWKIISGTKTYPLSGAIAANGFFLFERREIATSVASDALSSAISLSNSGERLELRDATGTTVDDVNPTAAAWPAGNSTTHTTMERVSPNAAPDLAASWASSTADGPATASLGTKIAGTPGTANSVASPAGGTISLRGPTSPVVAGSTVTVTLEAANIPALFAYGLDLQYPASMVRTISATEGAALAGTPAAQTAFSSGLLDGVPGTLRLAGARLSTPASDTPGSGTLATITVTLAAAATGTLNLTLAPSAFGQSAAGNLSVNFSGTTVEIAPAVGPVTALTAVAGTARYSLHLAWTAPGSGADKYHVRRKNAAGQFVEIGLVTVAAFDDGDAVSAGGAIIPTHAYAYEVVAEKSGALSTAAAATGTDVRGILGDSSRDDTTDGRDLAMLARSWGLSSSASGFNRLTDTGVDGTVDGADLVDLGRNWALTYTP